ncbi:hypothetical protein [Calothrix sp. UHCC 0171]|nr:hypothetical protein [Calothrix sp. UHCC 0171]MEA5572842.1 hypothetical protein [Calothrix sp. UHCC 0171]
MPPKARIIDISLGNAIQATALTKVKNRISIKFMGNYLLAIAGN